MIIGDKGYDRDCFESDLLAVQAAAADWGLQLRSFVYPRNSIDYVDTLGGYGFTAFRGIAPAWHARLPGPLRRAGRFIDAFLPLAAPTTVPYKHQGVWNIPASSQYLHRAGWGKAVPIGLRVRKARRSLQQAAERGRVFHLWLHPHNIATDPDSLLRGMESILVEAKALRDSGLLVNETMGSLAETLQQQGGSR